MDETQKIEIANRLRVFGEQKFSKIKDFAAALNMQPGALQSSYLNGRSLPGSELLMRLHTLGCDLHWLLFGEQQSNLASEPIVHYCGNSVESLRQEVQMLRQLLKQINLLTTQEDRDVTTKTPE